jgi:ribonuclease inhibitor
MASLPPIRKRCVLDGATLDSAAAVYNALGSQLDAPAYFGKNLDALWDLLTSWPEPPIEIVWQNSQRSAAILGKDFAEIIQVLRMAQKRGHIRLSLV